MDANTHSTSSPSQILQRPALPWEITDAIIDHLHADIPALGTCSAVCTEWLIRSRHHIFSTVQLWPWRVRGFFELAGRRRCTFTKHITRIEVDDSRARARTREGGKMDGVQSRGLGGEVEEVVFRDAMSHSGANCLAEVNSIEVRNVDWTALSPAEQAVLRSRLAKFSKLERLEFHDVVFHDLRELVRIVDSFPVLRHLTANISFLKYFEHTIAASETLCMPSGVESVELCTDDGIPVVLTSLANRALEGTSCIRRLELRNMKSKHLQYVRRMLNSGKNIQRLVLEFSSEKLQWMGRDELANNLDLSRLSILQTMAFKGLFIPRSQQSCLLEESLHNIIQHIESSFLETVELHFRFELGADLNFIDWRHLERAFLALHFFGMRCVRVFVNILPGAGVQVEEVERTIQAAMPDLFSRAALQLRVIQEPKSDGDDCQGMLTKL